VRLAERFARAKQPRRGLCFASGDTDLGVERETLQHAPAVVEIVPEPEALAKQRAGAGMVAALLRKLREHAQGRANGPVAPCFIFSASPSSANSCARE
jgi:hypothetical protein